jgi:hypothetical protein
LRQPGRAEGQSLICEALALQKKPAVCTAGFFFAPFSGSSPEHAEFTPTSFFRSLHFPRIFCVQSRARSAAEGGKPLTERRKCEEARDRSNDELDADLG